MAKRLPQINLSGTIDRVFCSSPKFSAGVLVQTSGEAVKFRGPFQATQGEYVTLEGSWKTHDRWGEQFAVENVVYEIPQTSEGLVQYLARHPAFAGIGEATARKIVTHVGGNAAALDDLIRTGSDALRDKLKIPQRACEALQAAWIANGQENSVRTYLAGLELSPRQIQTLLDKFGHSIVGILRTNPYYLIRCVKGLGFKRVDKIALATGLPKDHPNRIQAALIYLVQEQANSGHTWVDHDELVLLADELLKIDPATARTVIEESIQISDLVIDDKTVALDRYIESENLIWQAFIDYGHSTPSQQAINASQGHGLNVAQMAAYEAALTRSIIIISGGAGTGKTFTVARIAQTFKEAGKRVALCAPTGKAAKRIEESMRLNGLELEAKTIHRLLGYDGQTFGRSSLSWALGESEDEIYDVVIVDEFSMVDVLLMAEMLRRIDLDRTRLILVGDHNQLAPVGAGCVLRDCIQHNLVPVFILDEVMRHAGVLKTNSMAILAQQIAPTSSGDPAWNVFDSMEDHLIIQQFVRRLVIENLPRQLGLDPVRDVQIITPVHDGLLGTKAINEMMQHEIHGEVNSRFVVGDKVIQTVNDYDLQLMNGTQGIVKEVWSAGGMQYAIEFDGEGMRQIHDEQIANIQLAYCLTAHKAQGSEFPCAVVLCHKSHYFADRTWLYTAVTRAAKYCFLIGDQEGLRNAVKSNRTSRRRTFLDLWSLQQKY